ncbi:MAG TPA: poly(R)-hydroxyalkanoic acid synthase subunit PhaE [Nitrososphaera sp.]|nr:poly(R)-hydroxyalkanoic acid synthase subunit PhaE [Nitrososphaera sp.]
MTDDGSNSKNDNFKQGLNNLDQTGGSSSTKMMFDAWSEVLKLPTIGPMYAFTKDFNTYANEFVNLGKIMADMKVHMDQYWSMVNAAYVKASKETAEKAPKQFADKNDFDAYRKAMIEAFEDAFTSLYASSEFSQVYGKLFSSQLDMAKAMQTITERNFKALNLPTRGEVDEILKDLHELKRSVRELKRSIEKQ